MSKIELSIVIPCYNEIECLPELVKRSCLAAEKTMLTYEVVLIDDGSVDGSWMKMEDLKRAYPQLCLIKLTRNHGHQLALSAGLARCHASKYVFVIDADLQDPPELLSDMLNKLQQTDADVVYGQRIKRDGESFFKLATAALFYRTLRFFTDVDIPVDAGDFRLMKRCVVDVLNSMPEHARFIRGMVSWYGGRQEPFLYHRQKRFTGKTKYPLGKMLMLACDALISFSVTPLKFSIKIGCMGVIISILLAIYALCSYFFGNTAVGWTSIIAVIVFIGSIQLFILGIIGAYLGRIFIDCQNRPLFLIEKVVEASSADD